MEKGYTRRAWNKLREETIEKGYHTGKEERYSERWNITIRRRSKHGGETTRRGDYIEKGLHREARRRENR